MYQFEMDVKVHNMKKTKELAELSWKDLPAKTVPSFTCKLLHSAYKQILST